CMAAYGREHYARHRAKYLEKAHRSRRRVRAKNDERILSYLLAHPCVDCGETDPLVLDFDHREPATKSNEVSRIVYHRPWRVVLEEIEKCDVRCANCHRRKPPIDPSSPFNIAEQGGWAYCPGGEADGHQWFKTGGITRAALAKFEWPDDEEAEP